MAHKRLSNGLERFIRGFYLLDRSSEPVKGLSASVRDAILLCKTSCFIVMDGDNQHPPEYIKECIANLRLGADISIGTRSPFGKKWRFSRIIVSMVANSIAKVRLLLSGVTVDDPMSGFFGGQSIFVKNILDKHSDRIELHGYKILFNILKLLPDNTRLSGFYFPFALREYDASKFHLKLVYYFFKSIFK